MPVNPMTATRVAAIAAVLGSAAMLSGCGTPTVSGADVADQVQTQLEAKVGVRPEKVSCPDLEGKVGTKIRCRLTHEGVSYGVDVSVTSVTGNDVKFQIVVDDEPGQ